MRYPLKGAQAALAGLLALLIIAPGSAAAQSPAPGLRGTVASDQEGRMEGVVVSAKKAGATITVSVVSDANGEYSFPASRLDEGSNLGAAVVKIEPLD
jgi:virginiamycin B lyase